METKLLDLNAYGVVEMNDTEMRETDGGKLLWLLAAVAVTIFLDEVANPGSIRAGMEYQRNR